MSILPLFRLEATAEGKRKRTQNYRIRKSPYRLQNYTDHNLTAHAEMWSEYQVLSDAEK